MIKSMNRFLPRFCRSIVSLEKIKMLRDMTGSPIQACKTALDDAQENVQKAKELLEQRGLANPKPKGILKMLI